MGTTPKDANLYPNKHTTSSCFNKGYHVPSMPTTFFPIRRMGGKSPFPLLFLNGTCNNMATKGRAYVDTLSPISD